MLLFSNRKRIKRFFPLSNLPNKKVKVIILKDMQRQIDTMEHELYRGKKLNMEYGPKVIKMKSLWIQLSNDDESCLDEINLIYNKK